MEDLANSTITVLDEEDVIQKLEASGQQLRDGLDKQARAHAFALRQTGPPQMPLVLFEDDPEWRYSIAVGSSQVLPPGARHHVEIVGPVQFAVGFHRAAAESGPDFGAELVDE